MVRFRAMPRARLVASFVVAAICAVAAACSGISSTPIATKDNVIHDVDATELPPQPDGALPPDSPFAPLDSSSAFGSEYDAYAVLTVCSANPVTDAAAGKTTKASDAAYSAGGGTPCQPLPAACQNEPDCNCLFTALAAQIPCSYPHCSVGGTEGGGDFELYCPN